MQSQNFDEQAPGAGADSSQFDGSNQGSGGGYDQMSQSATEGGTGQDAGSGAHGSGVAGGYSGSGNDQQQPAEKQDWLDKGITMASKKAGYNISAANADKAGDFANKEFSQYEGRSLPGVE